MKSLVPQRFARSLLSLLTCGCFRENFLSLPRSLPRVYRENVHSSVDRRDYGHSLSRLPQRSTALDGPPGQLNVVRTYHNSLSEPFRPSGLRKPGPISLNHVLAQQDGLAERWRDRDRAGSLPWRRSGKIAYATGMPASGPASIGSSNSTSSVRIDGDAPASCPRRPKL
jgi:hypothetical protein